MDTSRDSISVSSFNSGIMTMSTISVEVPNDAKKVGTVGSITFKFTTLNYILIDSSIKLTIPNEMQWQTSGIKCYLNTKLESC